MVSAIHQALLNSAAQPVRRAWEVAHRRLSRTFNPEVQVRIGRRRLTMRFAHPLPFMLSRFPHYDTLAPRLARALQERDGEVRLIDVGANIGDTASLVLDAVAARILAIEPDPDYFHYLRKNTQDLAGVTCVRAALGDVDDLSDVTLTRVAGTAHMSRGGGETLDTLLVAHPEFATAQLLKIDTDGFDFKVLKGARRFLIATRAAVFFELAPEYYEQVGRENPREVFAFLRELGYACFVFYDNEGWLVFSGNADDDRVFGQLIDYARAKGHYYDVLAWHGTQREFATRFVAAERRMFAPAERAPLSR